MKLSAINAYAAADRAISLRIVMVACLSATLIVATRWASNITNANAKQISHNLTTMSRRMPGNSSTNSFAPPLLQESSTSKKSKRN